MKVASKVVFVFRDTDGFGSAISEALHPDPDNSSSLRSLEEPFELSLERYGIKDVKASGNILHFVDHQGLYQVSVLLMQNYEPPILACAVSEVLTQIAGENSSSFSLPTIVVPFVVASSKLKGDFRTLTKDDSKVSVYGVQIGPETDIIKAMATRTQKPSSTFQIHYEPLACLVHLAHVLNLPTFVLLGQRGQRVSDKFEEEIEVLHELGGLLASSLNLCFSKDKISWKPKATPKNSEEPWRALYG